MSEIDIAFIGGSGLYKIPNLKKIKWKTVKSSFGKPSSKVCGSIKRKVNCFSPRHGINHNISPSKINYRANIECLKKLVCKILFPYLQLVVLERTINRRLCCS